ncbi:unnamed protein product [Phyllotreta striolata]|uniref:Attacin C-terminal domain-containing protein n=1 Tax=Phyllotreta striolata TaxID=444603 RepID=A0A9P0GW70_PHYSR|nr:unnamed protein product [Phyllotreta striolata]
MQFQIIPIHNSVFSSLHLVKNKISKMKFLVLLAVSLTVAAAAPLAVFQDENGEEFALVPLQRQRRQTSWGANQSGFSLGHKGTLFDNGNHKVDGTIGASKAWGSHGLKPDSYNGRVDYSHQRSGSGAFVSADRTPGWGTDVNAGAKYNFARGKNWNADVTGQYGRHFGGPGGTGKPQAGVMLNVNAKF